MEFLDKLGDAISAKGKVAVDKAKDMAEVVNLKSKVSAQEDLIKKCYQELGKLYFEQYADMPDAPFESSCEKIKAAKEEIAQLQSKIKEIKGI